MTQTARRGFTLTEILIAMGVLAFAMLPLVGVLWSGVSRTDISVTYENAQQVAVSVLEFLLSDAVRFENLDFSNPSAPADQGANSKESSGLVTTVADANSFLGRHCLETAAVGLTTPDCAVAMSRQRYHKIGRENYHTDLYIGAYFERTGAAAGVVTSMSWNYLPNPVVDYEATPNNPQAFYDMLLLTDGVAVNGRGCLDYSPYFQAPWAPDQPLRTKFDQQISMPMPRFTIGGVTTAIPGSPPYTGAAFNQYYTNFAKIQLFIRWGLEWQERGTGNQVRSRGGAKTVQFVTFKGRI